MYSPKRFLVADEQVAHDLIAAYPFATVVMPRAPSAGSTTILEGSSDFAVIHLPLITVSAPAAPLILAGHLARANPQWRVLASGPATIMAIFHGPHAYITPTWYVENDVPTWNYAVVHIDASSRLVDDPDELDALLRQMATVFEGTGPNAWRYERPADLRSGADLTQAIVGFELSVTKITTKFKLSQNRSAEDQERVRAGLALRGDQESLGVRALMEGRAAGTS